MADVKISELPALTSPDGAEELVVNDGGTTKKITIANATSAALPKAGGTMTGALLSTSNFTANSTSSGDYVRMYGSSGTGKWDIYGNGANLRISDNEGAGSVVFDRPIDVTGTVTSDGLTTSGDLVVNTTGNTPVVWANTTGSGKLSSWNKGGAEKAFITNNGGASFGSNVDVTGTVTSDGLTVDGATILEAASDQLRLQGTTTTAKNVSIQYYESGDYGQINCDHSGVNQKDLWVTGLNLKFGRSTGSESMRITSSGNLGLGVVPSTSWHSNHVALQLGGGKDGFISAPKGQNIGRMFMGVNAVSTDANGNNWSRGGDTYRPSLYSQINGVHAFKTAAAGSGAISWSTAMTINNVGEIEFGSSSNTNQQALRGLSYNKQVMLSSRSGTDGHISMFYKGGSFVGSIQVSGSSTVYATSSDYRLKENVTPMSGSTARVKLLKPCNFDWISTGQNVDGFLAHEAQEVVPEAVSGTKDAMMDEEYEVTAATGDVFTASIDAYVDADENEVEAVAEVIHRADVEKPETLEEGQQWRVTTSAVMGTRSVPDLQGIDQSKLVPLLVATIQELIARVEALEA